MGKKSTKKRNKRKQPDLPAMDGPGVERPEIPEIEDIAKEYSTLRDNRMAALKLEVDAKKRLSAVMHKHNQTRYPFDDDDGVAKVVICEPGKETLKVAKADDNGEAEVEDAEAD